MSQMSGFSFLPEADKLAELKKAAHWSLDLHMPMRPERMRKMFINRSGFGSHCAKQAAEELKAREKRELEL